MKASTCVRVHFSSSDWYLAKKGIKELLKKKDSISDNVYQIILDIDKNIFRKGITFDKNTDHQFDHESKQQETKNLNTSSKSYDVFDKVMLSFVLFVVVYGLVATTERKRQDKKKMYAFVNCNVN